VQARLIVSDVGNSTKLADLVRSGGCPQEALRWTERHAHGRVIDTLSAEFPRLKKGYYCAVEGPSSRKSALDKAQSSKLSGKAPGAYVKEGC
jgi:hypothetical protein